MKISTIIDNLISYERGISSFTGETLDHDTDRDKYLFGDKYKDDECTGIVTTCWASADVIQQAIDMGANLIIAHEALFWNHGDHVDWLEEEQNKTYLAKKKLLEEHHIVIRRDHDHIHSGIPVKNDKGETVWADGIFYGFAKELGWEKYLKTYLGLPIYFDIPETTAEEVGKHIISSLNLNGLRIEGNKKTKVKKIMLPEHNWSDAKKEIKIIDQQNIDLVLTMEMIDFTLAEYIRDSSMLNLNKALIQVGHFNTEETGMEYMPAWLPRAIKNDDIPIKFVKSGDMYHYIF